MDAPSRRAEPAHDAAAAGVTGLHAAAAGVPVETSEPAAATSSPEAHAAALRDRRPPAGAAPLPPISRAPAAARPATAARPMPVGPPAAPRYRAIDGLELGRFRRPRIDGNRPLAWRAAWYLVNGLFFQSAFFGLVPARFKALLLRRFGARVGVGLVCKPRVSIKSPWFLEIGDHVWIGEMVWIDNHCPVRIGSNVCVSQGVAIFTGNHDWSDPGFAFFAAAVEIGDGSWVTAFQRLGPGTRVPPRVVVR